VSYLEEALCQQIRRAGLPAPERELEFAKCFGKKWRADVAWPAYRLMVEVQGGIEMAGRGGHISRKGYSKDCQKLAAATMLGWRVLYVTKRHIASQEAVKWIACCLDRRHERADEKGTG